MRIFGKSFIVCLAVMIFYCSGISAQTVTGERRVYYLDATYSMVSNKLWEPCKNNLIRAIERVDDVNTELVVIVFADDRNPQNKVWRKWEAKASDAGKAKLIDNIRNLPLPVRSSMTNLYDPWMDFYRETKSGKINYMFLMTDGGHEQGGDFFSAIDQWNRRTGSLTYGFFVELTEKVGATEVKARDKAREHIDRQKGRLWRVSSADININLIRLEQTVIFNVRNDEYVDIPIHFSGKNSSCIDDVEVSFDDGDELCVRKVKITNDNLRVYIDHNIDIHTYPVYFETVLNVGLSGKSDKTFLLTDKVLIKCLNKKERALFLSRNKVSGKVRHYDSFGWVKAKTDFCELKIDVDFNDDAISDPDSYVEFAVVDNEGHKLTRSSMIVSSDGIACPDNRFKVSPKDKHILLQISFPETAKTGVHQGYLKVIGCNMDRIDNDVDPRASMPVVWRIRYVHAMNPLAKCIMWLCILIVAILSLWLFLLKPINYPKFPKFRKMVVVKKGNVVVAAFSTNFKGARKVIFADKKERQSIINRIFTGKIVTVVNPVFGNPISFLPKKRKKKSAIVKADGCIVNPNPIPQSGRAVITDPANKLTIDLQ